VAKPGFPTGYIDIYTQTQVLHLVASRPQNLLDVRLIFQGIVLQVSWSVAIVALAVSEAAPAKALQRTPYNYYPNAALVKFRLFE
jgi:hypothetical protein